MDDEYEMPLFAALLNGPRALTTALILAKGKEASFQH